MDFFDCNCSYGVAFKPPLEPVFGVNEILDAMDRVGIKRCLVRNMAVYEETPEVGNPLTCTGAAISDRLEPAWALLPPQTGELGSVDCLLLRMKEEGVRCLWAYPSAHRYLLNRTTFGALFSEMQSLQIPLFLPRSETSGGQDAYSLADTILGDYPEMRLVVVGHGPWGEDRYFRPLMERYPHFAVDTSRYELDGGIEEICSLYGSHRLLFGTNFPFTPMGGPLLHLMQADISPQDRAAVAGGNLNRLLEEVQL